MDACRCRCVSNARVTFVVVVGSDERPGSVRAQHVLRGSACRAVRVSPMLYVTSLPQRSLRLRATDRWSAPSSWIPSTASRPSTNTELKAPPPPRRPHVCATALSWPPNMQICAMVQKNARPPQHTGAHRGPQSHSLRLAVIVCPTRTHARGRVYTLQMSASVKTIRAAAERKRPPPPAHVRLSPDVCAARAGVIVRAAKRHRRTPSPAHPPISAAPRGRGALTRRNKLAIRRKKARRHT